MTSSDGREQVVGLQESSHGFAVIGEEFFSLRQSAVIGGLILAEMGGAVVAPWISVAIEVSNRRHETFALPRFNMADDDGKVAILVDGIFRCHTDVSVWSRMVQLVDLIISPHGSLLWKMGQRLIRNRQPCEASQAAPMGCHPPPPRLQTRPLMIAVRNVIMRSFMRNLDVAGDGLGGEAAGAVFALAEELARPVVGVRADPARLRGDGDAGEDRDDLPIRLLDRQDRAADEKPDDESLHNCLHMCERMGIQNRALDSSAVQNLSYPSPIERAKMGAVAPKCL
jgi:hypothetical protein